MIDATQEAVRAIPLYAKQAAFRRSGAWCRGFVAGRGSGKTRIGAVDVMLRARDAEPWMAISPSYRMMWESTWEAVREAADQMEIFVDAKKSPIPRVEFKVAADGKGNVGSSKGRGAGRASLTFRSGDNPDANLGASKAGLWIDEASICAEAVFLKAIPILRYRGRMGKLLMTFTPRGRRHWTFETFFGRVTDQPDPTQMERLRFSEAGVCMDRPYRGAKLIGGILYRPRKNTWLTHAHTLDNPFLPGNYYDLIRGHYTSVLAAQELAGEFVDIEGLLFQRQWFRLVDRVPIVADRVRYWDRAGTARFDNPRASYSCGVLMARGHDDGIFYVEDVVRGQWSANDRDTVIKQTAERDARKYGNSVVIWQEQEGGSGGKEVAQQLVMKLAGFPVRIDHVSGVRYRTKDNMRLPGEAKIVRAQPFAGMAEAGLVRMLRGEWNDDYLDEMTAFPEYAFSDQVDGSSGSFNKLSGMGNGALFGDITSMEATATREHVAERFGVNQQTTSNPFEKFRRR